MRTKSFKILAFLLFSIFNLFTIRGNYSNEVKKYTYKEEKKIQKEFNISKDGLVAIKNQFGDINIATWDENKVVFDVIITIEGNNLERVKEKLNEINIDFSTTNNEIRAKTILEKEKSWWQGWVKKNNLHFSIKYSVKMPKTANIELDNDYGAILVDYLEGNADISCDYGKLILGELHGEDNKINFDYTKHSSIEYIKTGYISANYSDIKIEKSDILDIRMDYTKAEIEEIKNLEFNNDYGRLRVNNVTNITGNGDYVTFKIGKVSKSLDIGADYGSIKVSHILPSAKKIEIEADYTGIILGIDAQWAFSFSINLEYAGLKYDELPLEMEIIRKENSDHYYKGYHLLKENSGNININVDYGSVKLLSFDY